MTEKKCANCGVIMMYETDSDLCHLCTTLTKEDVDDPPRKVQEADKKDKRDEKKS